MKKIRIKTNKLFSLVLSVCIITSIFALPNLMIFPTLAADSEDKREADTNTMNSYHSALNLADNSLNSGRVWSDKSVLTDKYVELDMVNDGINGVTIDSESDFLHVFSALGSSRNYDGLIPANLVIVIDNSGSMYANDRVYWKWENTRIAKTVDAVNRAIDRLMENDVLAQVAVVSFNNTGRTIIPMGHYTFTPDVNGVERYTKYLDAGWVMAQEPDGNSEPNHTDSSRVVSGGTASGGDDDDDDDSDAMDEDSGGGYIYVNNAVIGANSDKKYTLYRSKSTNIQAGIYQGMQELLKAPKTANIPNTNIVLERIPSLVVLTDGQATDANKGQWSNPARTPEGLLDDLTFTNGFSKKKWLSFYDDCTNPNTGKLVYGWHRFLTTNNLKAGYTYKMMGPSEQGSKVADHYTLDKSKGDNRLPGLIEDFKETQEYMLLSTLMTAGYMKAAINNAYTQKCKVYTISVDMNDPADVNYKKNVANGSVDIDSNPPMMNPGKYFSIDWLKEVGVLKANNNVNTNIYKEKTTGSQTVYSIRDAVNDFQNWQKNGAQIKLNYRTITNTVKFTDDSKGRDSYIQDYTRPYGSSYWITGSPQAQTIDHLTNNTNNPYNLTDKDIDINYADVSYYAQSSVAAADSIESIFNIIMNQVTAKTFIPISGENDAGIGDSLTYMDPIGQYMEVKNVSDITLFGTQYGVTKTAVYDPSFISGGTFTGDGWYDSNGKRLGSGNWQNGTYYVSSDTAAKYIPALKRNIASTIYSISSVKAGKNPFNGGFDSAKKLPNPCYEDDSGITYSLGGIHIWVEDSGDKIDDTVDGSGIESDTGYDQALYVNIPANAVPLQVSTTKFKEDLNEADKSKRVKIDAYITNVDNYTQSTPLRVFYHVGLVESIMTADGKQVDREKISSDYIHENSNANGDIYFYSNWYKPNSYSYNSAGQTYTRGDPVLTFSPDHDNQYYTAQTPIILYTYSGNDDPNYEGLTVQRQNDGSYRTNNGNFTEVTGVIGDNQWYYIINSYFTKDKTIAYNAYARHSTEFGRDIGGGDIKNGAYLCWYNKVSEEKRDYIGAGGNPLPNPGPNWVVALRPGSLSTGNMSQSVGKKDSTAIPDTAGTYYLPTISSSTSGLTADGVVVNVYQGNNGRITVPSTQIIITKYVNSLAYELPPDKTDMDFEFELRLGNKTGVYSGTVLKRAAGDNGVWVRQVASVTVNTTDNGLLLDGGESKVHSVKTYGNNDEYYLYVPEANRTVNQPSSTENNDAVQTFTIQAYLIPAIEVDEVGLADWTYNGRSSGQVAYDVYKSPLDGGAGNALSGNAWTTYTMRTKELTFDKYSYTTFTLKDSEGILITGLNSGTDFTTREILKKEQGFNFVKVTNEDGSEYIRNDNTLPLVEEDLGGGTVAYKISGYTTAEKPAEAHYENTYATTLAVTKEVKTARGDKSKLKGLDELEFAFEVTLDGVQQGNFDAYVLRKNGEAWEKQVDTVTVAVTSTNGLLLSADESLNYEMMTQGGKNYYLYVSQNNRVAKLDDKGDYWITAFLIPAEEVESAGITDWKYEGGAYNSVSYKLTPITTDKDTGTIYGNARTESSFKTVRLAFKNGAANITLKDGEGLQIFGIDPDTNYTVTEILSKNLQSRNFSFTSVTDDEGVVYTTKDQGSVFTVVDNYNGSDGTGYQLKGTTAPDPGGEGSQAHYINTYNGSIGFELSKVTTDEDGEEIAVNGVEFMLEYKVEGKWYPVYYIEAEDSEGNTVTKLAYDLENPKTMEELKAEGIPDSAFTAFTSQGVNKKGATVDGLLKFENLFEGDFRLTEVSTLPGLNKLASSIEFSLPYAIDEATISEYEKNNLVQLPVSDDYTLSEDGKTRYYNYIAFKINNTSAQFDLPLTGSNHINFLVVIIGVAFVFSGAGVCFGVLRKRRKTSI